MSIMVNRDTRVLVQGITGSSGALHTRKCIEYGTNVVAGVVPGKGGQLFDNQVPIFDTVADAVAQTGGQRVDDLCAATVRGGFRDGGHRLPT